MRADYRLWDWIVRPRRKCIARGDEITHIRPTPMAVLECLANAGGEVVTRDELFEAVWPGVFVTDDALAQCIMELRKAFGDSAKEQRIIKTIPKVGFCLIPPVMELEEDRVASGGKQKFFIAAIVTLAVVVIVIYKFVVVDTENVTEKHSSVAVLPFANRSTDPQDTFFSTPLKSNHPHGLGLAR